MTEVRLVNNLRKGVLAQTDDTTQHSPCRLCIRDHYCTDSCSAYQKWFTMKWQELQALFGIAQKNNLA